MLNNENLKRKDYFHNRSLEKRDKRKHSRSYERGHDSISHDIDKNYLESCEKLNLKYGVPDFTFNNYKRI